MKTLQEKLRQLRSWQGLTLAKCAEKAGLPIKAMVAIEQEGRRWQSDVIESNNTLLVSLAHAYGVVPKSLGRWLEDEDVWRMCARDGNPATLPRMSQYIYRPLPEVSRNLFKGGFVIIDTETTGRDPHTDTEICEITILDPDGLPLLNSLVKPTSPIPAETTAIHGITDEMVANAPTFREIYPQIAQAIAGQTVCVYNANYDAYLLDRLCIENGLDIPVFEQWCLMEMYKVHIKSERWIKLTSACEREGVELEGEAHRSFADTLSTYGLLQKLAMQYGAVSAEVKR